MLNFDDGVHILGTDLYLDPRRARPRAIVSHAHSDHIARHERWVTSPGTAALCARRWQARDLEVHEFHAPWREGDATVTLLPAGHILGSSRSTARRHLVSARVRRTTLSRNWWAASCRSRWPSNGPTCRIWSNWREIPR
jgi:L-ascorbate metabolism protein UlaG (beta-lactamase superfamily)